MIKIRRNMNNTARVYAAGTRAPLVTGLCDACNKDAKSKLVSLASVYFSPKTVTLTGSWRSVKLPQTLVIVVPAWFQNRTFHEPSKLADHPNDTSTQNTAEVLVNDYNGFHFTLPPRNPDSCQRLASTTLQTQHTSNECNNERKKKMMHQKPTWIKVVPVTTKS